MIFWQIVILVGAAYLVTGFAYVRSKLSETNYLGSTNRFVQHQTDIPVQSALARCRGMNGPSSNAPRGRLLARSATAGTHGLFPELGVDRLCHPPAGHSRP
jgi:hypothetical protein